MKWKKKRVSVSDVIKAYYTSFNILEKGFIFLERVLQIGLHERTGFWSLNFSVVIKNQIIQYSADVYKLSKNKNKKLKIQLNFFYDHIWEQREEG